MSGRGGREDEEEGRQGGKAGVEEAAATQKGAEEEFSAWFHDGAG